MQSHVKYFFILLLLGAGISSCNAPVTSPTGIEQMKAAAAQTPANPAIVYNSGSSIYVMDSTGGYQTLVYTASSGVSVGSPNWSPGNSITWCERTSNSSSIRAADISVNSSGVPVSSNIRTITSSASVLGRGRWSSTTGTGKIAFQLGSTICRVSASGGTWDTLHAWSSDAGIYGLAWSPDDSKLAALLRTGPSGARVYSFVIINTSTGAVADSIPVSIALDLAADINYFDWSRSGGVNKLAFVSADRKLYYLTPASGSTPTTNNVASVSQFGSVTWSPNNSSVMFIAITAGSHGSTVYSLSKNAAQTSTVSTLDKTFVLGEMNWHR